MLNLLSIIGTVIIWDKYFFPILKILFPILRDMGWFLNKLLGCAPCLSFWAAVIYTHNPFQGFITFVLTAIIIREYDRSTV